MSVEDDLRILGEQETHLVFDSFDEDTAFDIGSHVRNAGKAMRKGLVVGVYLWDRTLFFGATAGASEGNRGWAERKAKLVRLQLKSSYRIVLERGDQPKMLDPRWAIDAKDYAISGGAFPLTIRGIGPVGAVSVSGLTERQDHELARQAIARALRLDDEAHALPMP